MPVETQLLDSDRRAVDFTPSMSATPAEPAMSWEEIGFLCEGMSLASRPMHEATRNITEEFSLGPRGAWILVLIGSGHIYPLDITNVFRIGRSLISAELARLTEAGLITSVKSPDDRRRTALTLTPTGEDARRRAKEQLATLVLDRLKEYSREEMMLCARMLRDWRANGPSDGA